jgi:hypothetical protein
MATTTAFGWETPDDTDLVKDGAAAIRTLGSSIDTSMSELKGGTTGQVLSKTTGTDMDFTWTTPSVGPTNVAGKNGVLNSNFAIWQRGTTVGYNANQAYNADRWVSSLGAIGTVSRQLTNDTTNLPFIQYCARVQRSSGQTSTAAHSLYQNFETVNSIPYVGKTVTYSFYARKGGDYSATASALVANVYSGTGTDQNVLTSYTGSATVATTTATLTTTWQRFTVSGTVSSSATEIALGFTFTPTGTASTNDYFEVTGVQLEIASAASAYSSNASTYQGELAACQRYFQSFGGVMEQSLASGFAYGTTGLAAFLKFNGEMRSAPTMSIGAGAASDFEVFNATASDIALTALSFQNPSVIGSRCLGTVSAGLVAGNGTELKTVNTTARIWASSEL